MQQKRQLSYRRAPCGLRLRSAAPPQNLYLFPCWAFVGNCWLIHGKKHSLHDWCHCYCPQLLFGPAGFSPCCHGGQYHNLPLALELFIFFVTTMRIGVWGEKFLFCSPSSSALGHWVCSFFTLQAVCPKPLMSSPEPDDTSEVDSPIHPHTGNPPIPWTNIVCPCRTHSCSSPSIRVTSMRTSLSKDKDLLRGSWLREILPDTGP